MPFSVSPRIVVWLILGLAFAVSANSIRNGFAFDDIGIIETNPQLANHTNPLQFFKQGYWQNWSSDNGSYRPVLMLSFLANHLWTGLNPWSYHLVNVLLHTANTGFLILLLRRHGVGMRVTAAAAILFAIHPIHTEAIANTVGRGELLAFFWMALAWLCWTLFRKPPISPENRRTRWGWFAASLFVYLLAILTKEHTLTLPALLFLVELLLWKPDALPEAAPYRPARLLPYSGFALMFLICLAARMSVNSVLTSTGEQGVVHLPFFQRLVTMSAAAAEWLRLLTVGYPLRPVYDQSNFRFLQTPDWRAWVGLGWLLGLAWIGWRARRKAPIVSFAVGFWFITASMMSNLFFSTGSVIAERMLYLPSVAFAILAAWLFDLGWRQSKGTPYQIVFPVCFTALCMWYGAVTVFRNPDWRDNQALFTAFLKTDPGHPVAAVALATISQGQGNQAEAERLYLLTLARVPGNLHARTGLGICAFTNGNLPEFERIFTSMLAEEPRDLQPVSAQWGIVHKVYGELLAKSGQLPRARQQLDRANILFPNFPEIQQALADVCLLDGAPDRAVPIYRTLIARQPDSVQIRNNLGVALMRLGRDDEAATEFREVLRVNPDYRSARLNLDFLERKKMGK